MKGASKYDDHIFLSAQLKKGEEDAFDYLFRSRYSRLCRFAVTFVNERAVAEDIVQDLFSAIWQKRERIDENRGLDIYLFVSVKNACYNYMRDRVEHVGVEVLQENGGSPEPPFEFENPVRTKLWQAVDELPQQCKIIFKLVVLEEMKYREVADVLNISVNSIKTQMRIAYKILREKLEKCRIVLLFLLRRYKYDFR